MSISYDFFHLLGYYAAQGGLNLMFQDFLLVSSSRVRMFKKKAGDLKHSIL
jgi:hypothetical protein